MRILVRGGVGYIGSVLVPMLLEHGYQVRVLDGLMYGGQSLLANFRDPNFEFIRGDIRNPEAV
jgi:nucleoside-diphosphate-sugar epimerase